MRLARILTVAAALAAIAIVGYHAPPARAWPVAGDDFFVSSSDAFIRSDPSLAAGVNSDTITGPKVNVRNRRRVLFRLTNSGAPAGAGAACSLAYIYVTNKDTTTANAATENWWVDANGLPGVQVIDNLTGSGYGDSIGGRTIELSAPGSGRIPWLYARPVWRMKCCANAHVASGRVRAWVQND